MSKNFNGPHRPRKVREKQSNGQVSRATSLPVRDETAVYRVWKERVDRLEEYLNKKYQ